MYNKPLRFDGDIIITDPCYIMRRGEDNQLVRSLHFSDAQQPQAKDFFSYPLDLKGNNYPPLPTDYPDCIEVDYKDPRISNYIYGDALDVIESVDDLERWLKSMLEEPGFVPPGDKERLQYFLLEIKKKPYSPTHAAEYTAYMQAFQKYQDATPNRDWDYCKYGSAMEKLGFTTYLADATIWGDWSCNVIQVGIDFEPIASIGQFCAGSGMVGVFLLDEALAYNPDFTCHTERLWTTTLIRDFHGWVQLKNENNEVSVVGTGSINFKSIQTGI